MRENIRLQMWVIITPTSPQAPIRSRPQKSSLDGNFMVSRSLNDTLQLTLPKSSLHIALTCKQCFRYNGTFHSPMVAWLITSLNS